jgi:hypothetical protein
MGHKGFHKGHKGLLRQPLHYYQINADYEETGENQ